MQGRILPCHPLVLQQLQGCVRLKATAPWPVTPKCKCSATVSILSKHISPIPDTKRHQNTTVALQGTVCHAWPQRNEVQPRHRKVVVAHAVLFIDGHGGYIEVKQHIMRGLSRLLLKAWTMYL